MKILLLEDNALHSTEIQMQIEALGFNIHFAAVNLEELDSYLQKNTPGLMLLDIVLGNNKTCFTYFNLHKQYFKIPTILLTQSENDNHYDNSKIFINSLYIIKPTHKLTLLSAINTLLPATNAYNYKQSIMVKNKNKLKHSLPMSQIVYIEQVKNYSIFHTSNAEYFSKTTLSKLVTEELDKRFIQIHRSFAVNKDFIKNINLKNQFIEINNIELPFGKFYESSITEYLIAKSLKEG